MARRSTDADRRPRRPPSLRRPQGGGVPPPRGIQPRGGGRAHVGGRSVRAPSPLPMLLRPALQSVVAALSEAIEARAEVLSPVVLAPLAEAPADRLVASLVRVEPDALAPAPLPARDAAGVRRESPPIALTASLFVAATHADYGEALEALDHLLVALHDVSALDVSDAPDLRRLTVEVEALALADLHRIWRAGGVPHRPGVGVRVRLLGDAPPPLPGRAAGPVRP